jgi:hypothetical protein
MDTAKTHCHKKLSKGNLLTHSRWQSFIYLLVLVGVVFLLYSNTFNNPFILDDWSNITSNISLRLEDFSLKEIKESARDSQISTRPISYITFALNYYFHQFRLPGYHLVNILIHVFAGIFLYLFFKITLSLESQRQQIVVSNMLAFSAALLWVIHPLHIQSVTYIVQRMNSMAAMFYILSMLLYVQARVTPAMLKKFLYFGGCLISGLLALGSKEIAATLPFFILLYEWYFLQDLSISWLRKRLLPIAAVAILFGAIVLFYLGDDPVARIMASYNIRDFSLAQRVLTEFRVVVFYISQVFLPHPSRLNLEHHFLISNSLFDPFVTLLSLGLLLVMFIGAILLAKRQRLISFSIFWFLGNLVIESSVIGLEIIFEHRTYLPSMLFVLAAIVLADRLLKTARVKTALLVLVFLVFSTWTFQRNMVWQDELALALDSVAKSPDKPRTHMVLGTVYKSQQKYDAAVMHYEKALSLNPSLGLAIVHYNYGNILMMQEKYVEAANHYLEAKKLEPNEDMIRINLANALQLQGKTEEAIEVLEELLRLDPENDSAHNNLGIAMLKLGRLASAEYHFQEALRLGFPMAAISLEEVKAERAKRARENYMFQRLLFLHLKQVF